MTKFTAIFKNGEVVKTSDDFRNRLDFVNWICVNRMGGKYGRLLEIREDVIPE